MDLVITLIAVLLLFFWPRLGQVRYYLLLFLGAAVLFIALVFAPILLLSPLFYLGVAVLALLLLYRGISGEKKEEK